MSLELIQLFFFKILGLSYLFAFWSLYTQVLGLYGSKGIIPLHYYLEGPKKIWSFPTVFWWNSSDKALKSVALIGIIFSLLLILGAPPVLCLVVLWCLWLSYLSVGTVFLSFQWDTLLSETGFIAIFYALDPGALITIAFWTLLFKFIFSSGYVKLASGCPEWRNGTALQYHYETQPLPNKLSYFWFQFPKSFSKVCTYFFVGVELIVPWFIFGTDEMRYLVFILLAGMQIAIFFTGNYAYFNLLSLVLVVPLLYLPDRLGYTDIIGIYIIVMNVLSVIDLFLFVPLIKKLLAVFQNLHIFNHYGLFASMTTIRDELQIEGSSDGVEWKPYKFKWKPGPVDEAPKQIAPFQPRLDWQMWFAALTDPYSEDWFVSFLLRLKEGSPEVLKLLDVNPFPDAPPERLRVRRFRYHFTGLDSKNWWTRTEV